MSKAEITLVLILGLGGIALIVVGGMMSWYRRRHWIFWNRYLIPLGYMLTGIALANLLILYALWTEPERWHDDAAMRKWAIDKIEDRTKTPFLPSKMSVEDIHGMDHPSLVTAGDSKMSYQGSQIYKG